MNKNKINSLTIEQSCIAAKNESLVAGLMAKMSATEKIGQMTLFTAMWAETGSTVDDNFVQYIKDGRCGAIFNAYTVDYTQMLQKIAVEETRLKIPLLFGFDVIHGHRTIFPIPLAEACSWDLALIEKSAKIAAKEAASEGIHWTFAPMVDVARDPRWGRVSEGAGEDVWLACRIAEARVKGFQGDDLTSADTVLACAKHFAAYGAAEAGRDYNSVDISQHCLHEVYLPPFKSCVDAGIRTFMPSFNDIAGVPCTCSQYLLTNVLREQWGFKGVVVSDYTAVNELIQHSVASDLKHAAQLVLEAGLDMDMQGAAYFNHLKDLLDSGKISLATIDEAVKRILLLKAELGLFEDPFRYCNKQREESIVLCSEHKELAQTMAEKSFVLLQNKDEVLPFSKKIKSLALIGPLADSQEDLLGNWFGAGSGKDVQSISMALNSIYAQSMQIIRAKGCDIDSAETSGFAEAIEAAKNADAVLFVLGESGNMSGEAACRVNIDLPGMQNDLVDVVMANITNKPVAAVLINGRPLSISRLSNVVPAILEAWFPGTMGAMAIVNTIFGDKNPSGKLVMSFPRHVGQIPIYYASKNTGRPIGSDKYTSKYLDCPNTPLFPFGHGLSYTSFDYSPISLSNTEMTANSSITASVKITNTGTCFGEEVVQLYIRDLVASISRPIKELKGCQKVALESGASAEVEFVINSSDLAFLSHNLELVVETGEFELTIGGTSASNNRINFILK